MRRNIRRNNRLINNKDIDLFNSISKDLDIINSNEESDNILNELDKISNTIKTESKNKLINILDKEQIDLLINNDLLNNDLLFEK